MEKLANNKRTPVAYWLVLALPVVVHFVLLWCYATNAPRLDDFKDALVWLVDFRAANTFAEKLQIFLTGAGEHRYGANHSMYWLYSELFGGALNFRWLTITANFLLVGLLTLLCYCVRRAPHSQALWVITALLLFNLQGWFSMFWTCAAIDRVAALLFALATFMLVVRNTMQSLLPAIITASVATLSQANGIFVWPIVGIYLWYSTGTLRHPRCMVWLLCASTAILLFLSHLIFFPREGNTLSLTNFPITLSLVQKLISGMLALPGSWLLYPNYTLGHDFAITLSVAIGALLWGCLVIFLINKCLWKNPTLLMFLAFISGSVLSVVLFRMLKGGLDQALQGHYKIFTALLLWLVVVAAFEHAGRSSEHCAQRMANSGILLAAVLYIAGMIKFFPMMQTNMQQLTEDTHRWLYTHNLQRPETLYYVPRYNEKLDYAVENGAYDPWTLATDSEMVVTSTVLSSCNNANMLATTSLQVRGQPKGLALRVFGEIDAAGMNDAVTLLLCSTEGNIIAQLGARNLQQTAARKYTIDVLVPRHNIRSREWSVFVCHNCNNTP